MTLPFGFEYATDTLIRDLANYSSPPKAGKVSAIEGSGQLRVVCEDVEGGDVLAWPLNGLTYAVDDTVFVLLALNNPESGIVIGSRGSDPSGAPFIRKNGEDELTADWDIGEDRAIQLEKLQARDGEGITFATDDGTARLTVRDDGALVKSADTLRHYVEFPITLGDVTRNQTITIDIVGVSTSRMYDVYVAITLARTNSTAAWGYAVGNIVLQHPTFSGSNGIIKGSDIKSDSSGTTSVTLTTIADGIRFTFGGGDFTNTCNANMALVRVSGYSANIIEVTYSVT